MDVLHGDNPPEMPPIRNRQVVLTDEESFLVREALIRYRLSLDGKPQYQNRIDMIEEMIKWKFKCAL